MFVKCGSQKQQTTHLCHHQQAQHRGELILSYHVKMNILFQYYWHNIVSDITFERVIILKIFNKVHVKYI